VNRTGHLLSALMCLAAVSGCAVDEGATAERDPSGGGSLEQPAAYGPDCVDALARTTVCDCDAVTVSWTGLTGVASVEAVVIDMDVESAAADVCDGSLTQSDLLDYAEVSVEDDGTDASSATFDLSGHAGRTVYISASTADRAVIAYTFASVDGGSFDDSVGLGE